MWEKSMLTFFGYCDVIANFGSPDRQVATLRAGD